MHRSTISILSLMCSLAACSTTMGGDDAGDDDGGGGGGGGGGSGNWTAIHLIDEGDIPRAANDLVSGMYFTAPDRGFVVTQGDDQSFYDGGAVFTVQGKTVSNVAFTGKDGGPSLLGVINFTGIDATPTGFIAMAYSADVITGDASGHFTIAKDGDLEGIEPIIGFRQTASGTTIVRETGVVSSSTSAPGPNATFTDLWAPNGEPPTPNPVPSTLCQDGPKGTGVPVTRASVYIGPDRSFLAYTAAPAYEPQICISTDHGATFVPKVLTGLSDDATSTPPSGVTFASATIGITYWASPTYPDATYLQRTTNSGMTWSAVALPSSVTAHRIELNYAFFAPDGAHGWVLGYDHDASKALALATADGGATWAADATGLAAAAGDHKLYSGFALDATHVWIGGDHGMLLASSK